MTTTYTFDQLKEDVRKEAEALRVHATQEERALLDRVTFKPTMYDNCIYGQMTGDCFSRRAAYLIYNCCERYFISQLDEPNDSGLETLEEHAIAGRALEMVNGQKIDGVDNDKDLAEHREFNALLPFHFSAIEAYIMIPEARNANLIAYLRGETETLEL